MSFKEIREFGSLVSAYRSDMPIAEFCGKLLELYGPDRKQYLKGKIAYFYTSVYPS